TVAQARASLNAPVEMDLVHSREGVRELHRRIMSEFPPALERLSEKLAEPGSSSGEGLILPFRTLEN
ncbi:MAG: hypothetical protein P8178_11325, partial [Candidatus Thiodiazotropha sp.]